MYYISEMTAQTIVEEISREIGEHINFMDGEGRIIASTDPVRIGMLHEGAARVICENLKELYITSEMESATARKGINLPITVNGEIAGVVGITGEKERVAGYGNIVRRMTEIMVEDSLLRDSRRYDRRVRYRFIEEWIAKSGAVYDKDLIRRGLRIGIDIERPRRALVIHFAAYPMLSGTLEGQKRLEEMEASIRHYTENEKEILYLREPPKQVCLIDACSSEKLYKTAEQIMELIRKKYGEELLIGIDSAESGSLHIGEICAEAEKAAENCREKGKNIVFYKELGVELFLDEITESSMQEYLHKLFPEIGHEELDAYMKVIAVFFEQGGSITRMAEALFMHKNTIQYKLKKLETLSGQDIRTPTGAGIYYMALAFYRRLYMGENFLRSI